MQVFLDGGVTEDQLRVHVGGKPMSEAIGAALDALESGKLVLQP